MRSELRDDWPNLLASEQESRIRGVLESVRKSLYLAPDIPPKKLANARTSMQVPEDETVIALVDCTPFGSAKSGIAFGERAIYYRNSWTVSASVYRGAASLPYERLARLPLTKAFFEIRFPGGAIEVAGSNFSGKKMLELLGQLQHSIVHGPPARLGGTFIASHLVTPRCLEPTNDVWPNGIGTYADASILQRPFEQRWEFELAGPLRKLLVARDFVIVVRNVGTTQHHRLIGLELTTGRKFWERDLVASPRGTPVATAGRVFVRCDDDWFAFDVETGEPCPIDVDALDERIRNQLALAITDRSRDFDRYCTFGDALAPPAIADNFLLLAANRMHRIYSRARRSHRIVVANQHGAFELPLEDARKVISCAVTEQLVVLGTDDRRVSIVDATTTPEVIDELVLPERADHLAVGSDHLLVGGGSRIRCFRGSY